MQKKIIFLLLLLPLCCGIRIALAQSSPDVAFNFDGDDAGKLPPAWTAVSGSWMVVSDGTNKAMKQTGKNKSDRFNICVNNKINYQNLEIAIRIKPLEGKVDQGGGLVWRYHDPKNYYVTRANPLENNFGVYKVVNGNRKLIKSVNAKMKSGEWSSMKVVMIGNTFDCYLNGQKLLSAIDTTFPNAGRVGFWSKADAISLFDDLKAKDLK